MSTVFAGPALSFGNTVLTYFSPSKSPFYAIIVFGTVALILSCKGIEDVLWWTIALPVYLVLLLSLYLSFKNVPQFAPDEHEEQLKFARSFSISIALVFFVFIAKVTHDVPFGFWVSYGACLTQTVIFLLYTWARSRSVEPQTINFVQFALITTTFLVGASYADWQFAEILPAPREAQAHQADALTAQRFLLVMLGLYFLWLCCIYVWMRHLRSLILVTIPGKDS